MGQPAMLEGAPLKIKMDASSGFAWNPAPTLILRFSLNLRIAIFIFKGTPSRSLNL